MSELTKRNARRAITAPNARKILTRIEAELRIVVNNGPDSLWPAEQREDYEAAARLAIAQCINACKQLWDIPHEATQADQQ